VPSHDIAHENSSEAQTQRSEAAPLPVVIQRQSTVSRLGPNR
jgi:hypothetical protein